MAGNVTTALRELFTSVAVALVGLLIFRDDLRARLRESYPAGVPLLTDAAAMISDYLAAERDRGRVPAGADVDTLALTLIGSGHLLAAGRSDGPPTHDEVLRIVVTVLPG